MADRPQHTALEPEGEPEAPRRGLKRHLGSLVNPARNVRYENLVVPYLLLGPAVLIVLATLLVPLFVLGNMSIRDVQMARLEDVFDAALTTQHLAEVVTSSATWRSLWVSLIYVLGSTGLAFLIGFATALLLKSAFPGQRVFRALVLVPWAVPGVTATVAFLWMMTPTFGVVNFVLRTLGIIDVDVNWFANPDTAMFAVIAPTAWKSYPFFSVVLLAGLKTIPGDFYEASAVDGAGRLAQFRYITWPGVRPYAFLALLFNGMHVFREFDFIYASTRGGPGGATETIAIRIYNEAFQAFRLGTSSALGVITFLVVAVVVVYLVRLQRRSEETNL